MAPLISVIVPLFNKAPYVRRAVVSALAQRESCLEVIVIDDGSTDGGAELLRDLHSDARLRILHQQNRGEGAARNHGLSVAAAPLAAFLDADDEWLPEHAGALLNLSNRYPEAALFGTGYLTVDANNRVAICSAGMPGPGLLDDYFAACCEWGHILLPSAAAARTSAGRDIGGFVEGAARGADLEWFARLALAYPVAYDPHPSARYYLQLPGAATSKGLWVDGPPLTLRRLRSVLSAGRSRTFCDYCAWLLLKQAAACVALGRKSEARDLLRDPFLSSSLGRTVGRDIIRLASYLPNAAITASLRARSYFRRDRLGSQSSECDRIATTATCR